MEFLQLNNKYGRVVTKTDNRFKGYICREDNGYFEGVALDLRASDNSSFVFGIINDDVYDIYQIFNRQAADYINYKAPTPYCREQKRGKVYSSKEGNERLMGYCFVSRYPMKSNVNLNELTSQINSCKDNMTIYDKKTYESIVDELVNKNGYIKKKTL